MEHIILCDYPQLRKSLLPLTFTRPQGMLRVGITTIAEKWQRLLGAVAVTHYTTAYLRPKFTPALDAAFNDDACPTDLPVAPEVDGIYICGSLLDDDATASVVKALLPGEALRDAATGLMVARNGGASPRKVYTAEVTLVKAPQDIFLLNDRALRSDFYRYEGMTTGQPVPRHCTVIGSSADVAIAPTARVLASTINTTDGPVYIGHGAEVMEGCCLRGPLAVLSGAVLKMGTKVYGATTVGPHCKVGGELSNVVFQGFANKAHDGFLGNAVVGEWCNLGAGCVASNLKNDYSLIRLWSYATGRFERTGMQFCGLIMGDHSKAGINTMFNTATVVGVGCNIFGAGFPRTFIPSFSMGGAQGFSKIRLEALLATARTVMARRHVELTEADVAILTHLYNS